MNNSQPRSSSRRARVATGTSSNLGFLRVGAAVPTLAVGNPVHNAAETVSLMVKAQEQGIKVLVFPELGLTGYTCSDLFQQQALRQAALQALDTVKEASQSFSGIVFVGVPLLIENKLFNCACAISGGSILGVVPKTFLPNYKEFYEKRWFAASPALLANELELFGEVVPVGVDLLFTAVDLPGLVIGTEICEDAWAPLTPGLLACLNDATVVVNLSASNELVGKAPFRRELVSTHSSHNICAYIYASSGVHESTTDVVFSGHSMIAENGSMLAENDRFERDNLLVSADVDLDRLQQERLVNGTFSDCQAQFAQVRSFRQVDFVIGAVVTDSLKRYVEAHPFVPKDKNTLDERCNEIFNIQTAALAKRLGHMRKRSGKDPRVTIGVSGGLDSTLALIVAARTFDMLGIRRTNIVGYTMPGYGTTARTKGNAHALMKELGITAREVDIRKACLAQMQEEGYKPFGIDLDGLDVETFSAKLVAMQDAVGAAGGELKDLYFENVQARMRTKILMDNGFVIGTGDLSELAKGWCTYNGDHMSMYNVNCSIPKTLVKFLVHWAALSQFDGKTRETLVDVVGTEISPELLPTGKDGKITQKTEEKVGPYELTDFFMYHMIRWGASAQKMAYLAAHAKFNQDYSQAQIYKWLRDFLVRFFDNQFKRSCVPDGPKVGSISLSPRGDWRMPSDAEAAVWLAWLDKSIASLPVSQDNGKVVTSGTTSGASTKERANMATNSQGNKVLRALLRVDILNCFVPGGSLPVAEGDKIVPVANDLSRSGEFDVVVDIQDWHPADHGNFDFLNPGKTACVDTVLLSGIEQTVWPVHGVQNTHGADFVAGLDRSMVAVTIRKGMDKRVDSNSGFYDNGKHASAAVRAQFPFLGQSTGLAEWLVAKADEIGADAIEVTCIGLALDICVFLTARDATEETYKGKPYRVRVVMDACRGLSDAAKTKVALEAIGVECVNSDAILPAKSAK